MELSKEYLAMQKAATKTIQRRAPMIGEPVHGKKVRHVTVEAEFAELKGGKMYQVGHGSGSNIRAAAANAVRDLLKQPGLKARRFTTCNATFSFGIVLEDTSV
jgi:hypothetical protein